jgi:predicted DNA-binding transcriptional regulator AlpA
MNQSTSSSIGGDSHSAPGALLDDCLTEDETARELNKHVRTLARWRSRREGPPFVKLGREVFYRRQSIRAWIARQEFDPAAIEPSRRRRGRAAA